MIWGYPHFVPGVAQTPGFAADSFAPARPPRTPLQLGVPENAAGETCRVGSKAISVETTGVPMVIPSCWQITMGSWDKSWGYSGIDWVQSASIYRDIMG
jgi:hypothetical protein